jgi:hypothetical protein
VNPFAKAISLKALDDAGETFVDNLKARGFRSSLLLAGAAYAHRISHELNELATSGYGRELRERVRAARARREDGGVDGAELQAGRPLRPSGEQPAMHVAQPPVKCFTCETLCGFVFIHPTHRTPHCSAECVQLLAECSQLPNVIEPGAVLYVDGEKLS